MVKNISLKTNVVACSSCTVWKSHKQWRTSVIQKHCANLTRTLLYILFWLSIKWFLQFNYLPVFTFQVKYVEQQRLLVRHKRRIVHDKQRELPIRQYEDKSVYQVCLLLWNSYYEESFAKHCIKGFTLVFLKSTAFLRRLHGCCIEEVPDRKTDWCYALQWSILAGYVVLGKNLQYFFQWVH